VGEALVRPLPGPPAVPALVVPPPGVPNPSPAAAYNRPGIRGCIIRVWVSTGPSGTRSIQVSPPSRLRTSAPASMQTYSVPAFATSGVIQRTWLVWGRGGKLQVGAEGRARIARSSRQVPPPSSERKSALGSVPA